MCFPTENSRRPLNRTAEFRFRFRSSILCRSVLLQQWQRRIHSEIGTKGRNSQKSIGSNTCRSILFTAYILTAFLQKLIGDIERGVTCSTVGGMIMKTAFFHTLLHRIKKKKNTLSHHRVSVQGRLLLCEEGEGEEGQGRVRCQVHFSQRKEESLGPQRDGAAVRARQREDSLFPRRL